MIKILYPKPPVNNSCKHGNNPRDNWFISSCATLLILLIPVFSTIKRKYKQRSFNKKRFDFNFPVFFLKKLWVRIINKSWKYKSSCSFMLCISSYLKRTLFCMCNICISSYIFGSNNNHGKINFVHTIHRQ